MVDRRGIPLAIGLVAANRPGQAVFEALLERVAPIGHPRGRPRRRLGTPHADKGYDTRRCCAYLRRRGVAARIALTGIESGTRPGRYRWVAERTLARLARYRRLTIRYERREDLHQAILDLGCALICLKRPLTLICMGAAASQRSHFLSVPLRQAHALLRRGTVSRQSRHRTLGENRPAQRAQMALLHFGS